MEGTLEIVPGVTAIQAGGHFDGSMVLHWEKKLFIADTMMIVPVGLDSSVHYMAASANVL